MFNIYLDGFVTNAIKWPVSLRDDHSMSVDLSMVLKTNSQRGTASRSSPRLQKGGHH